MKFISRCCYRSLFLAQIVFPSLIWKVNCVCMSSLKNITFLKNSAAILFLNSMRRSLNKAAANFFRGHLKTLLFIYNFIWSNYLSIYLEIPKHRWYENEIFNKIGFAKNKPNNGLNIQIDTRIISYSIFLDFDCFYKSHSTEKIENIWRGKK